MDLSRNTAPCLPVEKMCQVLEVSRSGYYDWKDDECHGMCGLDKILADVREKFPNCSSKRLYEIQKKNRLYAKRKKKFKATTNSNHKLPVAENLLNHNFTTDRPSAVWVTDISYIYTFEGWYLATVKDIFTKEIVGWATDNNMRKELCIKALENAVRRHKPPRGTIHYSDRGVQYCSREYQATL